MFLIVHKTYIKRTALLSNLDSDPGAAFADILMQIWKQRSVQKKDEIIFYVAEEDISLSAAVYHQADEMLGPSMTA